MQKLYKNEDGLAIVEATLLLPFCIIMVISIFYASIFLCQKANLQANLENALIYYKNVTSDTYVTAKSQMSYENNEGNISAVGSSYDVPVEKFPYRFFAMQFDKTAYESFFRKMCGYMFFDTEDNVEISVSKKNYVVYKEISVTVTQTVTPAINLSLVGISGGITIQTTGKVVINDGDDFTRNVDFVLDVISQTKVGQAISDLGAKITEFYNKFKEKFKIGQD